VLSPAVVTILLFTAIAVTYALRVRRHGRARFARLGSTPGSAFLPGPAVEAFYWSLQVPGRALARLRVDPDALTYLALAVSLASLPLIACGRLAEGGVCVALGGVLDVLDGLVARIQGRASASGAVLDCVTDRLADAAPFAGLAVVYRENAGALLVPIAALTASQLLSYARARADLHGLRLPDGPMRRHERIVYLTLSLFAGPPVPRAVILGVALPYPATLAGVAFIAAAAGLGAFLLLHRIRASLAAGAGQKLALPAPRVLGSRECPRSPA
jgi:phosphatidylglycerophosphate synthase